MMPVGKVVALLRMFAYHGIDVAVDGGWAVDAVLGEQTREHDDLDIAMPHRFVPELRRLLVARGYTDVPRDDTRDCNFVMGDAQDHRIDVHMYTFDAAGNNIFGVAYRPEHLAGTGVIAGYPVRCAPPAVLLENFRAGYPLDVNDYHDAMHLCRRFGFPMPGEFRRFTGAGGGA